MMTYSMQEQHQTCKWKIYICAPIPLSRLFDVLLDSTFTILLLSVFSVQPNSYWGTKQNTVKRIGSRQNRCHISS